MTSVKRFSQETTPGGDGYNGDVALSVSQQPIVNQTLSESSPLLKDANKEDVDKFPSSIPFIMSNEICERFSFYGLRAILAFYINEQLLYSKDTATVIVHAFTMCAYFTAVPGGYLSDAVLGKYRTILYVSLVYCLGSAVLAITAIPGLLGDPPAPWGMGLGLALVALGTGGIKPVVSAFVGDQFTASQAHLLERVFRMFYFCINFGSVMSTVLTPIIRDNFNYAFAFGLPAILLLVATTIFWSGRHRYRTFEPQGSVLSDAAKLISHATVTLYRYGRKSLPKGKSYLFLAEGRFSKTLIQEVVTALKVLLVFVPLPFFWALFDQHATRWIFQAEEMNLKLGPIRISADQVPALDPILVLMLVPIFDMGIYPLITRFRPFPPLARMAVGMLLTAGAFVMAAFLQILIDDQGKGQVNIIFQVPQYIVLASGEIMVSITGLEFAYTQAPKSMKSIIMSGWLITVAFGNLLVVVVAEMANFPHQYMEFFFFAALMMAALFLFIFIAYFYKNPAQQKEQEETIDD